MSLRCLKQISIERGDISKTSQKHFKTSQTSLLWRVQDLSNTSQKRCFSGDIFRASQTYLKKDFYSLTSLICLKNISWKYLWLFKNNTQKWFLAGKINVWALKTLRKMKRRFLWAMHSHQSVCRVDSYLHVVAVFQISGAGVLFTFFAFTCF